MKKTPIISTNLNPNFIGSWTIEPTGMCDDIIDYFEKNVGKQQIGATGEGINTETKDSLDIKIKPKEINLPGNEIFKTYFNQLFECYKSYVEDWPFLTSIDQKLEIGAFNLQRYNPGQHFKKIHTERLGLSSLHRIFAFMTYLNDVEDGGSTYFSHYDLKIEPRKGLTLIWPAEWTHAHRGNILVSGKKYIITGWIQFTN